MKIFSFTICYNRKDLSHLKSMILFNFGFLKAFAETLSRLISQISNISTNKQKIFHETIV